MKEYKPHELSPGINAEKSKRDILKAFLLAALFSGFFAVVHFSPLGNYLDTANINLLRDRLAEFRLFAPVIFFAGGAVIIVMGVPRSVVSILGGMIFGFSAGMFLSLAATLGGSVVIFSLTRFLGRPLFNQKIGQKLKVVEGHIKTNGLLIVILLRQLPLPCMFVNALIGLTSVATGAFLLGSILGHLPQALIFSLYGSSVQGNFILRVSLASFLLVLFVFALRVFYKRSPLARDLARKLSRNKTA